MPSPPARVLCTRNRGHESATILLAFCSLALLACGVPISASEITATAAVMSLEASVSAAGSDASSRAAGSTSLDPQATSSPARAGTPLATLSPLTTPAAPQPTPTAAATVTTTPAVAPAAAAVPIQPAAGSAGSSIELISDLLRAVNGYRAQNGRPSLVFNASLTLAASNYARLMAERNFFSHDAPDGSTPESRIRAAGYRAAFRGETLAGGQTSAQAALIIWQNSPAHSRILLDASAAEVGIGYYYSPRASYGHYWVLVTGAP